MNANTVTGIRALIIGSDDPDTTSRFVDDAFGLTDIVHARATEEPTSGFRGFSLSLVFDQPADVDHAAAAALKSGARQIKPMEKSFWGYGGALRAPDGTVWTLASSSKKNTAPATGKVGQLVVLLGVSDVRATRDFYRDAGLTVARSFGGKYVEFAPSGTGTPVTLALQSRRAVAKNAGVDPDGSGSHRLIISGDLGSIRDPDGFTWE